jgi:hypothetical protein
MTNINRFKLCLTLKFYDKYDNRGEHFERE